MTTRLILICHAPTASTRAARFPDDEDLDEAGAAALSALATSPATRFVAAPERRTRRTADLLGAGASASIDPALADWDVGRWRGHDLADLHRDEPDAVASWLSDFDAAPHGGESLHGLLARIGPWLAETAARGGRTLAVTHPAVLRAAIVRALDVGPAAFWRIDAPPSCEARLSHDGRRWTLQGLAPHHVR